MVWNGKNLKSRETIPNALIPPQEGKEFGKKDFVKKGNYPSKKFGWEPPKLGKKNPERNHPSHYLNGHPS